MAKHTIEITVDGGLIQSIENIPAGVAVRVRDYDIEGCEENTGIVTDEDGNECYEYTSAEEQLEVDNACPTCGGTHPPCKRCGAATHCPTSEPGEPFVFCDSCDAEMRMPGEPA